MTLFNNRPGRCPSCDSRQPSMHPAVSGGGEVTVICPDSWHDGDPLTECARQRAADESPGLLTVAEVKVRLGVSEKTVRRMLEDGTFTKLKVRAGVRIDPAEFAAYKRQLREQAAAGRVS